MPVTDSALEQATRSGLGIHGVSHISLVVGDLDRAQAFYEGFLGLTPAPVPEGAGRADHYLCGGVEIHLLVAEEHPRPTRRHLAFEVPEFGVVLRALDRQRVNIAGGPMRREQDGSRYVFCQDPDGNLVEIVGPPDAD